MEKQGLLAAVRDELISRARRYSRSEAPISYSKLADRLGIPTNYNFTKTAIRPPLSSFFVRSLRSSHFRPLAICVGRL